MNNLDFDMATLIHAKMRDSGINLHLGANGQALRKWAAA